MIKVTLGKDVIIEHFTKFAFLYKKVIQIYKLFEYAIDIEYYLPVPSSKLKFTADKILLKSTILDYAKIAPKVKHFSKTQHYVVTNMNLIYNKVSKAHFNYNFSRNDMLILNRIYKLLKK